MSDSSSNVRRVRPGLGVRIPNSGPLAKQPGITELARAAERSGATSIWVGDHIVFPRIYTSRYPYAQPGTDGRMDWDLETPQYDTLISLALMIGATNTVTVGTAVLVLPLRNPVDLAKAVATLDVLAGGRLVLGLGAGWLAEEFQALDVEFETRGAVFEDSVQIMSALWEGDEAGLHGKVLSLPPGVICRPLPTGNTRPLLLVGGDSEIALRRSRQLEGWIGIAHLNQLDLEFVEARSANLHESPASTVAIRLLGTGDSNHDQRQACRQLWQSGADVVIVDVPWHDFSLAEDLISGLAAEYSN